MKLSSGELDKEEFIEAFGHLDRPIAEQMFDEVDINGDGGISKDEFDAAFGKGHLAGGISFEEAAVISGKLAELKAVAVAASLPFDADKAQQILMEEMTAEAELVAVTEAKQRADDRGEVFDEENWNVEQRKRLNLPSESPAAVHPAPASSGLTLSQIKHPLEILLQKWLGDTPKLRSYVTALCENDYDTREMLNEVTLEILMQLTFSEVHAIRVMKFLHPDESTPDYIISSPAQSPVSGPALSFSEKVPILVSPSDSPALSASCDSSHSKLELARTRARQMASPIHTPVRRALASPEEPQLVKQASTDNVVEIVAAPAAAPIIEPRKSSNEFPSPSRSQYGWPLLLTGKSKTCDDNSGEMCKLGGCLLASLICVYV